MRSLSFVFQLALAVTALAAFVSAAVDRTSAKFPIVTTDEVTFEGTYGDVNGVSTFYGIRYGQPPVGALRWTPSYLYSYPKLSVVNASLPAAACYQLPDPLLPLKFEQSEDCLFLNIFTPNNGSQTLLPVLVWIYGGSFVDGFSTDPTYLGQNLALSQNVVVVSLNYRLGPFGFLGHEGLFKEEGTTGNYGILDQQLAVSWLQEHISAFGGDPTKITLFGQSAGAISIDVHLASPLMKGLFRSAITESGDAYLAIPLADSEAQGATFASLSGCDAHSSSSEDVLNCMRALSPEAVLSVLPIVPFGSKKVGAAYGPVIDGYVISDYPQNLLRDGSFQPRAALVGANHNEARLFVMINSTLVDMDATLFNKLVTEFFEPAGGPTLVADILALYPVDEYSDSAVPYADTWAQILSDFIFICPARDTARSLSNFTNEVYLYNFTYVPDCGLIAPPLSTLMGAYHGAELPFVFGNQPEGCTFSASDLNMTRDMQSWWGTFAVQNQPNIYHNPLVSEWPAMIPWTDRNLNINGKSSQAFTYNDDRCDFWSKLESQIYVEMKASLRLSMGMKAKELTAKSRT